MNKKAEILIFCGVVLAIGLTFAGGIALIRSQVQLVNGLPPEENASTATGTLAVAPSSTPNASSTAAKTVAVITAPTPPAPVVLSLPYTLGPSTQKYWLQYWGALSAANGALLLSATTTTTGGSAFLDHAASWTNYTAEANVQWVTGGWFDIASRVTNNTENFVYCEFGANTLGIVRRVNYVDTAITTGYMPTSATPPADLGMSVYGNDVSCLVNGKEVLGASVPQDESASGGVGFIAWGKQNEDQLIVKNLAVVPLTKDTIQVPFALAAPAVAPSGAATGTAAAAGGAATSTPAVVPLAPAAASQPFVLPYSETNFKGDKNWQSVWGAMRVDASGAMNVGAATTTSGGTVYLKNSENWTNYTFNATLDWVAGQTFGIVARRVNNDNYVDCNYFENSPGDIQVELQQYSNGVENTLAEGTFSDLAWNNQTDASVLMTVNGPTATCSFNGFEITNNAITDNVYSIGAALFVGGIGFTTWDPVANNSMITVKQISVTPNY